jgi:chitinase
MAQVESSQVACIGHDPATNTLAVQFKHGAGHIYHFQEVSAETHAQFMAADSKGKFFKERIKPLSFKKYPAPQGDGLSNAAA